jgi:hypothetical protein
MSLRLLLMSVGFGVCFASSACSSGDDDSGGGAGAQAGMSASGGTVAESGHGGSAGLGGSSNTELGGSTGSGGATASGGSGGTGAGAGGTSAGTGSGDNLPDVEPATRLTALDTDQKSVVCDWVAGLYGGYGVTTQCPAGGSSQTFPSRDVCVSVGLKYNCLTVTVGDVEACELSAVPSGGCDRSDASCKALYCEK